VFEKGRRNKGGLREYNKGGKLVQSALNAPMVLLQRNPLLLLMYANKNSKEKKKKKNAMMERQEVCVIALVLPGFCVSLNILMFSFSHP
jgi:hypothetical protein